MCKNSQCPHIHLNELRAVYHPLLIIGQVESWVHYATFICFGNPHFFLHHHVSHNFSRIEALPCTRLLTPTCGRMLPPAACRGRNSGGTKGACLRHSLLHYCSRQHRRLPTSPGVNMHLLPSRCNPMVIPRSEINEGGQTSQKQIWGYECRICE